MPNESDRHSRHAVGPIHSIFGNVVEVADWMTALLCVLLMLGLKIGGLMNISWALIFAPVWVPLLLGVLYWLFWSMTISRPRNGGNYAG